MRINVAAIFAALVGLGLALVLLLHWFEPPITKQFPWLPRATGSSSDNQPRPGAFIFSVSPEIQGDQNAAEALQATITESWQAYLDLDAAGYSEYFAPDAVRLSGRAGSRQVGQAQIQAGMPAEWSAFERPNNQIAETMTVTQAEFEIEGNFATATYWLEIEGGQRWHYTDQALVFQAFVQDNDQWRITDQTDAWSLDYDVEQQQPGENAAFGFDFAYPVQDLNRAVKFYTPLLGEPELTTPTTAIFNLKGGRFILAKPEHTWAKVRQNLPNGYALFTVADAAAETAKLTEAEVQFLESPQNKEGDTYSVGLDSEGNAFMLWEKDFQTPTTVMPKINNFPAQTPQERVAKDVIQAWMEMDSETLANLYTPQATWFDDTQLKNRGQERGDQIITALESVYWPTYDHGDAGLAVSLDATNTHTRMLGTHHLVSYEMTLKGEGPHPFQHLAWVTQVLAGENQVRHTFIVGNTLSQHPVLELDYTGYPVADLTRATDFYGDTMQLGEGYDDQSYYGFWSNGAVFGLYQADPDTDDLPQPGLANGYVSFWVRSAADIYDYLAAQSVTFPIIPAINTESGPNPQPGYTQVVATDSEGNIIVFTEYSGRPR